MILTLKEKILESGIQQQFIDMKAGINSIRLSKIIHGHIEPNSEEKLALARVLDVTIADIFPEDTSSK